MADQFCACGTPGDPKRVHTKDRCYISMDIQRDLQKRGEAIPADITRGERRNNAQLCGSCGADRPIDPHALFNDCPHCGDRIIGQDTPPIEDLNNLCRSCRHPISPEHDDFGCNIPGCPCAVSGAIAIDQIQAVLPNADAREHNNSYGNYNIEADLRDGLSVSACAKKLHDRYPDIDMKRAMRMVEQIRKEGAMAKVDWTKHGENANAAPDAESAVAAFVEHQSACAQCKDAGDASALCADGSQLLVMDLANEAAGGVAQAALGFQQPISTTTAKPEDEAKNASEPSYAKAQLITLWAREGDAWVKKNPQMADLVSFGSDGRVGPWNAQGTDIRESFAIEKGLKNSDIAPEHLDKDAKDLAEIARHAEGIEHEVSEMQKADEQVNAGENHKCSVGDFVNPADGSPRDRCRQCGATKEEARRWDGSNINSTECPMCHGSKSVPAKDGIDTVPCPDCQKANLNGKDKDCAVHDLGLEGGVCTCPPEPYYFGERVNTMASREAAGAARYGSPV